jgi:xanthine phosphoribosyltransferase
MTEKHYLSIEECVEAAKELHKKVISEIDMASFKGIVTILNGGMFPAYWLRKLLKRDGAECALQTIDVQSYDDNLQQGEIQILQKPDLKEGGKGWVFVDEVSDTGATFEALRKYYPEALFVSLTAKPNGAAKADISILQIPQEQWIVFPWEIENL